MDDRQFESIRSEARHKTSPLFFDCHGGKREVRNHEFLPFLAEHTHFASGQILPGVIPKNS